MRRPAVVGERAELRIDVVLVAAAGERAASRSSRGCCRPRRRRRRRSGWPRCPAMIELVDGDRAARVEDGAARRRVVVDERRSSEWRRCPRCRSPPAEPSERLPEIVEFVIAVAVPAAMNRRRPGRRRRPNGSARSSMPWMGQVAARLVRYAPPPTEPLMLPETVESTSDSGSARDGVQPSRRPGRRCRC